MIRRLGYAPQIQRAQTFRGSAQEVRDITAAFAKSPQIQPEAKVGMATMLRQWGATLGVGGSIDGTSLLQMAEMLQSGAKKA